MLILGGCILVGAGFLTVVNSFRNIKGFPVRNVFGILIGLVLLAAGAILLARPGRVLEFFGM